MTQGIYCYIDKKNNCIVYIGKDSYIDKNKRYKAHLMKSQKNNQLFNRVLQNNPKRYIYKILEEGNISQKILNALEMSFIQKYNPKFNFTKGGDGSLGYKFSKESKMKMSKNAGRWNKGKKLSDSHKRKISESHKGLTHTEETKNKLRIINEGKITPQDVREKMSKSRNSSGYYRVHKNIDKTCKQGFIWRYTYRENGKLKKITSVDIKKLEKKVKEKGLIWKKF